VTAERQQEQVGRNSPGRRGRPAVFIAYTLTVSPPERLAAAASKLAR